MGHVVAGAIVVKAAIDLSRSSQQGLAASFLGSATGRCESVAGCHFPASWTSPQGEGEILAVSLEIRAIGLAGRSFDGNRNRRRGFILSFATTTMPASELEVWNSSNRELPK